MSVADDAESEVEALHDFIEDWFAGRLPETAFDHPEAALADDFRLITPRSERRDKDSVLSTLRSAHASKSGSVPPFEISIERLTVRDDGDDHCLLTYEEWQRDDGDRTGRRSTALFRPAEAAPNGVEWVHLHESWIPAE
ncbi:hypothetical protein [Halobaculum sp. D14]|uniref:hypothetical protein n=1 Tax=unclassified Halobaculum TaxID=2640896 RepID=UPI003EBDFECF